MEKVTVVINGVGGCGKDTLITFLNDDYLIRNVSSITPIKHLASIIGWNGEKDEKSRKFLADLKKITTDYNEYPLNYILREQKSFLSTSEDVMFIHIREPEEIQKFVECSLCKTITLLIRPRIELEGKIYGNYSDDNVENYNYDLIYENNKSLEETKKQWLKFFREKIIDDKYVVNRTL